MRVVPSKYFLMLLPGLLHQILSILAGQSLHQALVALTAVLTIAGRLWKYKCFSDDASGQAAFATGNLLLEHFAGQEAGNLALLHTGLAYHLDQGGRAEVDDWALSDTLPVLVQVLQGLLQG